MHSHASNRVFQFDDPSSPYPSAMRLSGQGELVPVRVAEGGRIGYAKGGLADAAQQVEGAGRHGDDHLIHVNEDEFHQLTQMWGPPTVNPETGMPEFFLGGLFKVFKKLLPVAAMFIPGIGPAIGSALGVGATAGNALLGAGLGALNGGWKGALMGGALGGFGDKLGLPGAKPKAGAPASGSVGTAANGPVTGAANTTAITAPASAAPAAAATAASANPAAASLTAPTTSSSGGFLGTLMKDSLIRGVPNALLVGGLAALAGGQKASDPNANGLGANQTLDQMAAGKLSSSFNNGLPAPSSFYGNLGAQDQGGINAAERYAYGSGPEGRYFNYAKGGSARGCGCAGGGPQVINSGSEPLAVRGPGTGRSDDIPAKLSDGEYVMDAETVAMLGDGSNKAGADKLDKFRVNVRKHKGGKLAKGKISPNAKQPDAYLRKGRG